MVKINVGEDTLEHIREMQEEQRKERRRRRNLLHIDESEMVEPAKKTLEERFLNDYDELTWFHEPSVQVRERDEDEAPAKVQENPDLIAVTEDRNGNNYIFIVELKKVLGNNKRSVHQSLLYYWSVMDGTEIKSGSKSRELTGTETIFTTIGYLTVTNQYYDEFFEWLINSLDLGSSDGFSNFYPPFQVNTDEINLYDHE
ncbi:hypothetical protein EGH25_11635 [Haladaptatus sp. F3-133]|jgi:hypothetical protein|uniref:Uncharacterized protein n=1 Tax=Halorutilus salinus TaxID=2487751 RepID=A0A9Q4C6C9_9EURY|nr:hypothetical protein [Halorutilus salinus]MCX2820000.1 hypothetical protein [Halorutilus salinus]